MSYSSTRVLEYKLKMLDGKINLEWVDNRDEQVMYMYSIEPRNVYDKPLHRRPVPAAPYGYPLDFGVVRSAMMRSWLASPGSHISRMHCNCTGMASSLLLGALPRYGPNVICVSGEVCSPLRVSVLPRNARVGVLWATQHRYACPTDRRNCVYNAKNSPHGGARASHVGVEGWIRRWKWSPREKSEVIDRYKRNLLPPSPPSRLWVPSHSSIIQSTNLHGLRTSPILLGFRIRQPRSDGFL